MTNQEKVVLKNMCFFNSVFLVLFFDFLQFWVDFGKPWALQKSVKNQKNWVRDAFGTRSVLKEGSGRALGCFGRIFDDFLMDFVMIWERFLEGFGGTWRNMCEALQVAGLALMIRATRSRSIDR